MKPVRVFLDNSLEVAIASARVAVMLLVGAAPVVATCFVWTGDARWTLTLAVMLPMLVALGWFGFWQYGNEEWRRGKADNPRASVRDDGSAQAGRRGAGAP